MTSCLLKNEPVSFCNALCLRAILSGDVVKAIPNWDITCITKDPKPGELTMNRVNLGETQGKARTRDRSNDLRRFVVRGDILNEPGDSWFSPKYILV